MMRDDNGGIEYLLAVMRAATEQALSGGDGPMGPKRVTTDATIAADLRASLKAHRAHAHQQLRAKDGGMHAGKTWAEFKLAMHALGIIDSDVIASIEYGCGKTASGVIVREDASDGIEIRETR